MIEKANNETNNLSTKNKRKSSLFNSKRRRNAIFGSKIIRRKSKFFPIIINEKHNRSSVIQLKNIAQDILQNVIKKQKKKEEEYELKPNDYDKLLKNTNDNSKIGKLKIIIKYIDILLALCVIGNIFFSLIENELFYKETKKYLNKYFENKTNKEITQNVYKQCEKRKITLEEDFIRQINVIIVIIILILNFFHYYITLLKMEEEGLISEKDNFYSTGLLKYLILESLILGIFDPPSLNYFFTGIMENYIFAFSLGGLICIETLFKSYVILRVYTYFSKYMTNSAKSICNNSNTNSGVHFAIKCELKNRPYTVLFIIFISFIFIFGFSLRTFEYFTIPKGFLHGTYLINDQDYLKDLINSIWLTIVTMTTVGYGDFYPNENYGRLIVILSYLIGAILVSMTVVSLAIITEFTEEERRAYSIIKKLNAHNNTLYKAGDVISCFCYLRLKVLKNCSLSEKFIYLIQLKKSISTFKDNFKLTSSLDLPLDQTLMIINKEFNASYEDLYFSVFPLKELSFYINNINFSQKDCIEKLEKIKKRQEKLGDFLVQLNNDNFKNGINKILIKRMNN